MEEGLRARVLKARPTVDPEEVERQAREARLARCVSPEDVVSGAYLPKLAAANAKVLSAMAPARPLAGALTLTWASACSGSEGPRFVAEVLNQTYAEYGLACRLEHVFSCEIMEEKKKWIHSVNCRAGFVLEKLRRAVTDREWLEMDVEDGEKDAEDADRELDEVDVEYDDDADDAPPEYTLPDDLPCIFNDIQDLHKGQAACWEHNGFCNVPAVDLFIVGTSCKDMSRANPNPVRGELVLAQASSKGGSAQTFHGLLTFLEAKSPAMVLFENVDSIEDAKPGGSSNLDVLKAEMSSRGYEGQIVRTDAHEFGLPCHRRRIFALFVKVVGSSLFLWHDRPYDVAFQTFRGLLSGCLHTSPCVTQVLYGREHPAVLKDLKERQVKQAQLQQQRAKAKAKAMAESGHVAPAGENWVEQHMKYAESHGLELAPKPPPRYARSGWFQVLTEREKNALLMCQQEKPEVLFRDLSQSIARINSNSWSEDRSIHVAPTMLPRMQLWIENTVPVPGPSIGDRLLLGQEALLLQGFPIEAFLSFAETGIADAAGGGEGPYEPTQALMMDLAGNAMPLPTVLAMLQAGFCALSWRPEGRSSGDVPHAQEQDRWVA